MIWATSDLLIPISTWKFNNSYWQDPDFKIQLEQEMKEFLEIYLNGEGST